MTKQTTVPYLEQGAKGVSFGWKLTEELLVKLSESEPEPLGDAAVVHVGDALLGLLRFASIPSYGFVDDEGRHSPRFGTFDNVPPPHHTVVLDLGFKPTVRKGCFGPSPSPNSYVCI